MKYIILLPVAPANEYVVSYGIKELNFFLLKCNFMPDILPLATRLCREHISVLLLLTEKIESTYRKLTQGASAIL